MWSLRAASPSYVSGFPRGLFGLSACGIQLRIGGGPKEDDANGGKGDEGGDDSEDEDKLGSREEDGDDEDYDNGDDDDEGDDDSMYIKVIVDSREDEEEDEAEDNAGADGSKDDQRTGEGMGVKEKRRIKRAKHGSTSVARVRRRLRINNSNRGNPSGRPRCTAPSCSKPSRPDSKYCSDRCGVLTAEVTLSKALVYSLEEREGRERGKRLREVRDTKAHRGQVRMDPRSVLHWVRSEVYHAEAR